MPDKPNHPRLPDLDAAIYTVRDKDDQIVGEFRTEDEALAYGSHLANANPDDLYSVVVGKWVPSPDFIARKAVDPLQRRADEIAEADRAEEANHFFSASLCYAKGSPRGVGVHLTLNGRTTLCGLAVYDEPTLPRGPVEPLNCEACYEADHGR